MRDAREVARFMNGYTKGFAAGAFAMPTAQEIAARPDRLQVWESEAGPTYAWATVLTRSSTRKDFAGDEYVLPAGARVISHLARPAGAPVPDLSAFDYVTTYVEDFELAAGLRAQGREQIAVRVSAASELIAVWGREGDGRQVEPINTVDVARIEPGLNIGSAVREAVLADVRRITGWDDDFPLYSDGSWDAVSLRGYRPDDPSWGVKPSEMPRKWHEAHPGASGYRCDWTRLADEFPTLRAVVESVAWWGAFDRVRLMRMRGRQGRPARLARHSDITDRSAGTRVGQMVRFFVPLITDPSVKMTVWGLDGSTTTTHMSAWGLYYLDIRKPHAVVNPSGIDRVQLAVDVIVDMDVRRVLGGLAAGRTAL